MSAKIKLIEYLTSPGYLPKLEQALLTSQQKSSTNYQDHTKVLRLIDEYNVEQQTIKKDH